MSTPTTDMFMYRGKQNIKYFLYYFVTLFAKFFFNVYANFHQYMYLSLRKVNIYVVSINSEQPTYAVVEPLYDDVISLYCVMTSLHVYAVVTLFDEVV